MWFLLCGVGWVVFFFVGFVGGGFGYIDVVVGVGLWVVGFG